MLQNLSSPKTKPSPVAKAPFISNSRLIKLKTYLRMLFRVNWNYYLSGVFILLVAFGITGSSLGWYESYPGADGVMELVGEKKIAGAYRGIRGDEFIAHGTPNALAQYNSTPRFSKLNDNLGIAGRNLLMLHDLGAPVAHPSIIAKPATWGFFIFDLRRALAWYWWFPVFLFIWGFRWLLDTLFRKQTRWNFILSITAAFAPISAGWSFWPANNAAGVCIAVAAFLNLVKTRDQRWKAIYSLLIGWGVSCSALSLYFPRFYTISLLLGIITAMELTREKSWKKLISLNYWPYLALALAIFGIIMASFLGGAYTEWLAVKNSIYPGLRRNCGGTMGWWTLVKGWLAPLTVYKLNFMNQCEIQGELSLLFPLLIYSCLYFQHLRRNLIFCGIVIFSMLMLVYQHIGLPEIVASSTLFAFCNPPRCGMALSMGQVLLIALLISRFGKETNSTKQLVRNAGLAILCLTGVILLMTTAPNELWKGLLAFYPHWYLIGMLTAIGVIYITCGFLLLNNSKWFVILFAAINILPGIIFNPVCIAPYRVDYKLSAMIKCTPELKYQGKILWATGNDFLAVTCYLAGGRTFNGYFLYDDKGIFKLLFQNLPNAGQYHRMNHLDIEITAPGAALFEASIPYNDRIVLQFNGTKYNFSQLPVDFLAALPEWRSWLSANRSLKQVNSSDGIDYYRVVHQN